MLKEKWSQKEVIITSWAVINNPNGKSRVKHAQMLLIIELKVMQSVTK